MPKRFFLACCFISFCFSNAYAQKNEFSSIMGGGRLSDSKKGVNAFAMTASYTRSIIAGLAAEGSLDAFFVETASIKSNDYTAAQVSLLYRFGSINKSHRVIPYITVGIGKITTDWTEILSDPIYKLGAGVEYYFSEQSPLGLRVEVRDEITRKGHQDYPLAGPRIFLVSLRAGVSYRF